MKLFKKKRTQPKTFIRSTERFDRHVKAIKTGVIYRARKHFNSGDIDNPYTHGERIDLIQSDLRRGMAMLWDEEMGRLKKEKVCPCCGQPTMADIDW